MSEQIDGGPAFPTDHSSSRDYTDMQRGMSLLDWFAGRAMQGLLASDIANRSNPRLPTWCEPENGELAELSYDISDSMLKARTNHLGKPVAASEPPDQAQQIADDLANQANAIGREEIQIS